jgi:hypothetical protein
MERQSQNSGRIKAGISVQEKRGAMISLTDVNVCVFVIFLILILFLD